MPLDEPLTLVSARFRTNTEALGFPNPPAAIRVKLVTGAHGTSLFIRADASASPGALVDWIQFALPRRITFGDRAVLRADFLTLPTRWQWARGRDVEMIRLDPSGEASVTMRGTRARITAFAREVRSSPSYRVDRVGEQTSAKPLLTAPQAAALRAAWSSGYYEIPRPLNLQKLAATLGITSASLSERLRRAEARVIGRYLEDGPAVPPAAEDAMEEIPAWPAAGW
jgi:hypothetical protein